jgi:hypothetical protein
LASEKSLKVIVPPALPGPPESVATSWIATVPSVPSV